MPTFNKHLSVIVSLIFFLHISIASFGQAGSLDLSFDPGTGSTIHIWTTCVQPDGKILIGGSFTSFNGNPINRLARLNSDGSLDLSFNIGTGPDWDVKAISLQSDGKIIIVGWFGSFNGVPRPGIARLNSDGTLDLTFDPGTGAYGDSYAVAIQPDGKIILGGAFSEFNGVPKNKLVRLNTDGSIDPTFYGCAGVDNTIFAIALQADGKILLGGEFTNTYICGSPPISVSRLIRLSANGLYDSGFTPQALDSYVWSLAVQSDGKILVGGRFTGAIRRLNINGTTDVFPAVGPTFGPTGSQVNTILVLPNGKIIIGGSFETYNSISRNNIIQLNQDGTNDATFNPGTGTDSYISSTALQSDGKVVISGYFTSYNAVTRNRVARINGDCTIPAFNPFPDTIRNCDTTLVLNAGSGYSSYLWDNGGTSSSITINRGGYYSVRVTNASGCTGTDTVFVDLLKAGILNNDTIVCKATPVRLTASGFTQGFVKDVDGNKYPFTTIGKQLWFQKNLNTTKYRDGSEIPNITSVAQWSTYTNGAWCWYNNDSITYGPTYGKLYIWYTTVDSRNLAPEGWHVPTNTEMIILTDNLGGLAVAGGKLKEVGYSHWLPPNTGATNSSRFNGLPGGIRNYFGNFEPSIGKIGLWWSSTESSPGSTFGWQRAVYNDNNTVVYTGIGKNGGISVRCISDRSITYLWSTGQTSDTIQVSPIQTTTYYVTISDGITTCIDSVKVTVDNVDTSLTLLDPPVACNNGSQIRIKAGVASSYQWLLNSNPIAGANAQIYSAAVAGNYRVIVTNARGCIDTSRSVSLSFNPLPVPAFSVNSTVQCSSLNQFSFTNNSTISAGTIQYLWNFGDGNTSTDQHPVHSYTSAGIYSVKLYVVAGTGCIDSTTQTVTVNPSPVAAFSVNNSSQCLTGNSFVFNNTSAVSAGILTYLWTFGDGNTSNLVNPVYTYAAVGSYPVKLIATSTSGCKDSMSISLVVNSMPAGSIILPSTTIICDGSSVTLTATQASSYQWYLNNQLIPGATTASYSATQPGIYSLQLSTANGCSGSASNSITLTLVKQPVVNFSSTNSCAGFSVYFTDASDVTGSGQVSYSWNFGDGGTSVLTSPVHIFLTPGTYTVTETITPNACPALAGRKSTTLNVQAAPPSQRYTTLNAVEGTDLNLSARDFLNAGFNWIPASGLNNTGIRTPVFNYNRQQEYIIRISTTQGCIITDTLLVRMFKKTGIYLPGAFTPNNDGSNDLLIPRLVGIQKLNYFKVFDRWGQLIYQTSIAGQGWDGTYRGVKQPIETYTWTAEGIDINNIVIRVSGNTALIR